VRVCVCVCVFVLTWVVLVCACRVRTYFGDLSISTSSIILDFIFPKKERKREPSLFLSLLKCNALSLSMSLYPSLSLSFFISLSLSLYLFTSVFLSLFLSLCSISFCLSTVSLYSISLYLSESLYRFYLLRFGSKHWIVPHLTIAPLFLDHGKHRDETHRYSFTLAT